MNRSRQNPELSPCLVPSGWETFFYAAKRFGPAFVGVLVILGLLAFRPPSAYSQISPKPVTTHSTSYASVRSFRIIHEKDGPVVEILSTKPLIPAIQALSQPDRLVIDLPNAHLDTPEKRISVQADMITTLRANQFQQSPPVVRVVVDLLAPRGYTWEAAGNRLLVHLGKNPLVQTDKTRFQPPSVPSLTPAPKPVVAAVRPAGQLALIGSGMVSGSSITAGADTAVLGLARGGEVHVCPGTTVSVTPAQNGHNLMLGVNTGAIETHYTLDASADSIMTPDFRIVLSGPGEFHYAISADRQGNTCVRALPGNTAAVTVAELLGDRTFQVKPADQYVFHSGQLAHVDMAVPLECGCPPARPPVERADNGSSAVSSAPPSIEPKAVATTSPAIANTAPVASAAADGQPVSATPATPASPASTSPGDLHVQVEAPFVFRATGPPPAPVEEVRALPLDSRPLNPPPVSTPLPPPQQPPGTEVASAATSHRGFFHRLGAFFAAIFR